MTTEETFHTGRRVPSWDGRPELFSRYKFDVNMDITGSKKRERVICCWTTAGVELGNAAEDGTRRLVATGFH